jgi:hypothetical protein
MQASMLGYAYKLKNKNKRKAEQTMQTEVDEEKTIMNSLAKAEAKGELEEHGVRPACCDRALKKARREEKVVAREETVMAHSEDEVMASGNLPSSDDEDSVSPGDACESGFFTLIWRYIEEQTLQYRKEHGIASDQLEDTLAAMHADGWRLSAELQRSGIPQMLYEQFTAAAHGKTIYTAELFRSMRVPAAWD